MTNFLRIDSTYRILADGEIETSGILPVGNYLFRYDEKKGVWLEKTDSFTMPEKVYGSLGERTKRILYSFDQRKNQTTGVLLSGYKGSGKTLLARNLCIEAKLPVIIIDTPYNLSLITDVLSSISVPFVLLIDEFEKKYPSADDDHRRRDAEELEKASASFLSFLDGTSNFQRLVVLTVNNSYKVNSHLLSRPGRVFYHYTYTGMSKDEITSYLDDKLVNKDKLQLLRNEIDSLAIMGSLTFDILQAIVEEVNRYPDVNVHQLLKPMNIGLVTENLRFDVFCIIDGIRVEFDGGKTWVGNPFEIDMYVGQHIVIPGKDKKDAKKGKISAENAPEFIRDLVAAAGETKPKYRGASTVYLRANIQPEDFMFVKNGLFVYKCSVESASEPFFSGKSVEIVLKPNLRMAGGWLTTSK
jgi:hypothetical protein